MSKDIELFTERHLKKVSKFFIERFGFSYGLLGLNPELYGQSVVRYKEIITTRATAWLPSAASMIGKYSRYHGVRTANSVDEFKLIYFFGMSVEAILREENYPDLAKVHLVTMIAILDYRMQYEGINKQMLSENMIRLIKDNLFHQEMGKIGCYLTYKCAVTAFKAAKDAAD